MTHLPSFHVIKWSTVPGVHLYLERENSCSSEVREMLSFPWILSLLILPLFLVWDFISIVFMWFFSITLNICIGVFLCKLLKETQREKGRV